MSSSHSTGPSQSLSETRSHRCRGCAVSVSPVSREFFSTVTDAAVGRIPQGVTGGSVSSENVHAEALTPRVSDYPEMGISRGY